MTTGPDIFEARGRYIGPVPGLKGQTAKLTVYPSTGRCLADFDQPDTAGYLGPHDFALAHFELEATANG